MIESTLLVRILEAALMTANKPMTIAQMQQLFDQDTPDKASIHDALSSIADDCVGRGVELVEVSSGWRFQVQQAVAPWVGRLFEEKPQKYSRATLETLALIAYRQPITRGEIEEVRGVAVSSQIMRSLQEREWVKIVGHRDVPGRPAMYATTREFLDYLGLKSLESLPTLADIRDLDVLNQELDLKLPDELLNTMTEAPSADESATASKEHPRAAPSPSDGPHLPVVVDTQSDALLNAEHQPAERDNDRAAAMQNLADVEQQPVTLDADRSALHDQAVSDADAALIAGAQPTEDESLSPTQAPATDLSMTHGPADEGFSELIPIVAVGAEAEPTDTFLADHDQLDDDESTLDDMAMIDALNAQMADSMAKGIVDHQESLSLDAEIVDAEQPLSTPIDDDQDPHEFP